MGLSKSEPVFVDTNLGTHLVVPVSPGITVMEFKRDLEGMHLNCFPEFGSIRVNALMVKQKSRHYHLSESLPVKYAFLGSNGTWFLQMDAHKLSSIPNPLQPFECNGTEVHNHKSATHVVTDSVKVGNFLMCTDEKRMKCKRKISKIQRFPCLMLKIPAILKRTKITNVKKKYKIEPMQGPLTENQSFGQFADIAEANGIKNCDTNVITEAITETFSESVSVSGIIKKYFSDYDEVASNCRYLNVQSEMKSRKPGFEAWREKKSRKLEVGKRLLQASDNLGLSPSDRRPEISLCKSSGRKSPLHKSKAVRNLVFEITEESD